MILQRIVFIISYGLKGRQQKPKEIEVGGELAKLYFQDYQVLKHSLFYLIEEKNLPLVKMNKYYLECPSSKAIH
jgi:hypothetical protein